MEKVFCEKCNDFADFVITNVRKEGTLKGLKYEYWGKEAHCKACGEVVFVPFVHDSNLRALHNEYRRKNGIIPLEKIYGILDRYKIGRRPLSLMLGWGEQTFSRYCDGEIPKKEYSDQLLKLYEDVREFNKLLEQNKNLLNSEVAYKKAKRAVEELLVLENDSASKLMIVAKYILHYCDEISQLALQKLLYYIQGFSYVFNDEFIFTEDCEAWVHGPVYPDVYNEYGNRGFNIIREYTSVNPSLIPPDERIVIDTVVRYFGKMKAKQLEEFTHIEKPWLQARGGMDVDARSANVISKKSMKDYFGLIKNRFEMKEPDDIVKYIDMLIEAT